MACLVFGTEPLFEAMLGYEQLHHLGQNTRLYIHENTPDNIVWEMASIVYKDRLIV